MVLIWTQIFCRKSIFTPERPGQLYLHSVYLCGFNFVLCTDCFAITTSRGPLTKCSLFILITLVLSRDDPNLGPFLSGEPNRLVKLNPIRFTWPSSQNLLDYIPTSRCPVFPDPSTGLHPTPPHRSLWHRSRKFFLQSLNLLSFDSSTHDDTTFGRRWR